MTDVRRVGFRRRLLFTTLVLVAGVMLALVLLTQLVLELNERSSPERSSVIVLFATIALGSAAFLVVGAVTWRVASAVEAEVAAMLAAERRLTAELAHELRTPLTALQGTADLALLRGVSDPELDEDLHEIRAAGRRLGAVMASLLDGADLPRPGADRAELALQAVAPLLDNALRHASTCVTVTVEDDGEGVTPAEAGRVFDPGRTGADGHGLGLPIARRLARSAGGDVELVGGSRFVLRLPRD